MNTATALKANTADTVKMTIRQWATEDRPSEKLQMYGVEALSDAELISILIGSGTSKLTAVDVAQNILDKFDCNLNTLGRCGRCRNQHHLQSHCSSGARQAQTKGYGKTPTRYEHCNTHLQLHATEDDGLGNRAFLYPVDEQQLQTH